MRRMIGLLIAWCLRGLISLRYKVEVVGLDEIRKKNLKRSGGILFLPNHPALVDPAILMTRLFPKFKARAMIVEYMYYMPGLNWLYSKVLELVPVPSFEKSSNTYKVMRSRAAAEEIKAGLKGGGNYIVYPAGQLKRTPEERVGGASLANELIHDVPEANVVLVRTSGLWGSRLSWGLTGTSPDFADAGPHAKMLLFRNLFFFSPRRKVTIEFEIAGDELYQQTTKIDRNRWLEAWFNRNPPPLQTLGEPTKLVSYARWKSVFPRVTYTAPKHTHETDVEHIPIKIRRQVIKELVRLSGRKPSDIRPDMHLLTDLGLDSLDMADLFTAIERVQGSVGKMREANILTVAAAIQMAAGELQVPEEEVAIEPISGWKEDKRPEPGDLLGKTLYDVLLRTCDRMDGYIACADDRIGIMTYKQLKLRALAVSRLIAKMPGRHIGILLPSSSMVHIAILACWLAGKIPTTLNWTIGYRYLEAVKERADIQVVLSSWTFLDRLDGADLTPIHDMIRPLETLRSELTLKDKLWAKKMAKRSDLIEALGLSNNPEDEAILLFTSGTEAMPKAVPLTHHNLLSNQRAALATVTLYPNDIFYGILPPFHSLGFSIAGIVPLLIGGKAIYSPDPTNASQMVRDIIRYRPTVICSAPTFLSSLFSIARPDQLSSLRLYIAGAEKAPRELFDAVHAASSTAEILEGYGITECSPVLTINRPGEHSRGVGYPLSNVEIKIVHPETHRELPQGEVGLILAKGENVFAGYLGGEKSPFIDEWYDTGDLGSIDEAGAIHLAGRLKRFVKVGGEMVSLPGIESALYDTAAAEHWGGGQKTVLAVVAVEIPGQRPQLILFSNIYLELDYVNEALRRAGISNLARLTAVRHIADIPLMGSGKCNYPALQEMAQEMVSFPTNVR